MTLAAIGAGVGIVGAAAGIYQGFKGASDKKKALENEQQLFKQRKAYQTPSEILDIYNTAKYNAQSGFDPTTMSYLTSQAEGSLATTLDTSKILGGDPNNFASIINQNFQDIFRIGSENDLAKMKKFDALTNATQLVAQNKDAEYASQQNLIKDQMAAEVQKGQAGAANEQSGINLALNGLTSGINYYKTTQQQPSYVDNTPNVYASVPQTTGLNNSYNFEIQAPKVTAVRNPITGQ